MTFYNSLLTVSHAKSAQAVCSPFLFSFELAYEFFQFICKFVRLRRPFPISKTATAEIKIGDKIYFWKYSSKKQRPVRTSPTGCLKKLFDV